MVHGEGTAHTIKSGFVKPSCTRGSHPAIPCNLNYYVIAYPKIPRINFARYPRTVSAHVVSACTHTRSVSRRNVIHCLS
jgi:hypothetical protein